VLRADRIGNGRTFFMRILIRMPCYNSFTSSPNHLASRGDRNARSRPTCLRLEHWGERVLEFLGRSYELCQSVRLCSRIVLASLLDCGGRNSSHRFP
jgi:hypothetical protein